MRISWDNVLQCEHLKEKEKKGERRGEEGREILRRERLEM